MSCEKKFEIPPVQISSVPTNLTHGKRTVRNIGCQSIEGKSPGQWIRQCLFQLVHLEMLVADTLLVMSDALHRHDPFLWRQETRIELIVRHQKEEDDSNARSYQADDQKDDLPRVDCCAVFLDPDGNTVGN